MRPLRRFIARLAALFARSRDEDRLREEFEQHIAMSTEDKLRAGLPAGEARRKACLEFGSPEATKEAWRDQRTLPWVESLFSDLAFGGRQLRKHRTATAAAILSLALATGACTSAFRLIDAMLLRPLPVRDPGSLYVLTYDTLTSAGVIDTTDGFEYPPFRILRDTVKDEAELLAISGSSRIGITFGSPEDTERAYREYVSGGTFAVLGLHPALGRAFTPADDVTPGGHPLAMLSYEYWQRRFAGNPNVIGMRFHNGNDILEIIGVAPKGFTGTETGSATDLFMPAMMNAKAINDPSWGWFRAWARIKPGIDPERVRQKLNAAMRAYRQDRVKAWAPGSTAKQVDQYVSARLTLQPAAAGVSAMQKMYRQSLLILAALVALVLLIACANVANLMTARALSRSREMALRVSIGAGRLRLIQMVLVESLMLGLISSGLGAVFAWRAAPFVVSMINPPNNPIRLNLPADWRVLGFATALTLIVTMLFGLAPALRASAVKPSSALKGGDSPEVRHRLMSALVAVQVAFCFLVHFNAGLFVSTFERLASQPTGFSSDRLLLLETAAIDDQPMEYWRQLAAAVRSQPGAESVAISSWAPMSNNSSSNTVWANGKSPDGGPSPHFLSVSPGWFGAMKIGLLEGRDFRETDTDPQVAIVNETFARTYFGGANPVGKSFEIMRKRAKVHVEIIGEVRDARYNSMRDAIRPTVYVPFNQTDDDGSSLKKKNWATIVARTSTGDPMMLAPSSSKLIHQTHPEFRVASAVTQSDLVRAKMIRERMLALLSVFFAAVALLLAGIGLYGVLDYSVLQRRREIGIRIALGARSEDVVWRVTTEVFGMLLLGAAIGVAMGVASEHYVAGLLFEVSAADWRMVTTPAATILLTSLAAAFPPVIRAIRIDPAKMLRTE
jgi:predicted permease